MHYQAFLQNVAPDLKGRQRGAETARLRRQPHHLRAPLPSGPAGPRAQPWCGAQAEIRGSVGRPVSPALVDELLPKNSLVLYNHAQAPAAREPCLLHAPHGDELCAQRRCTVLSRSRDVASPAHRPYSRCSPRALWRKIKP